MLGGKYRGEDYGGMEGAVKRRSAVSEYTQSTQSKKDDGDNKSQFEISVGLIHKLHGDRWRVFTDELYGASGARGRIQRVAPG
eukprot:6435299-Pyramimonas_sp.AAC.1